jgi:sarcosine oxidase gamma subunit
MGEGIKTGLAMIAAHSAVADAAEGQVRIDIMGKCVINTAAAE